MWVALNSWYPVDGDFLGSPLELHLLWRRQRASGRARVLRSDQTRVG